MKTGKMVKSVPIVKDTSKELLKTSFSVGGDQIDNKGYEESCLQSALASLGIEYAMKHATVIKLYKYFDRKGRVYETPDPLDQDYCASAGFVLDSYNYFIFI